MDYPTNSHRQKEPKPPAEKKIQQITTGDVVRRKKPLSKRFAETFVGGDARGVWGYIVLDVLVPAAKDTIADAFSQGIERMLFGDSRSPGRRSRPGGQNGYVSYNRYAPTSSIRRDEPRNLSRRSRASHDFDEIILSSRVEAEEVIDRLFDLISRYDVATVADLYELVGVDSNYTDNKWGWSDIRGTGATRTRGGGYLLDLPRPEPLD
jgi:hypothetical protein